MRRDALQFTGQDTNCLRAFRNLQTKKFLSGHHIGEVVTKWIQVIHSVRDNDSLLILLVFKQLLHARVEVTDIRGSLDDHFSIQHQFQT